MKEEEKEEKEEDHYKNKGENIERFHQLKCLLSAIKFLIALKILLFSCIGKVESPDRVLTDKMV